MSTHPDGAIQTELATERDPVCGMAVKRSSAHSEEGEMAIAFGDAYRRYAAVTPGFIPLPRPRASGPIDGRVS